MLNTTKLFFVLFLLLNVEAAWVEEITEAEALPPAVQLLIDKGTQDVAKERVKYDAAAKKLTDKLAADLKKEVEKATKTGNLKLALAVQAQLDEVTKGSVVTKVDEKPKDGDLLGASQRSSFVGTWNILYSNGTQRKVVIDNKYGVSVVGGAGAGSNYTILFDKKYKVYVGYFSPDQNKPETYRIVAGKIEINHWGGGGDWKTIVPTHTATATKEE